MLSSDNWDVLTLVSNTISYNYEAFSVLHPIADLEQRLFHRVSFMIKGLPALLILCVQYKELKIHQPFNKPFAAAFLELLSSTRKEGPMKQELEYDLETFELHNPRSQVARSPISETMDDIFDDGDMENNEEIDRLWHTGASVDRDNLSRLFETTVSKMETSFEDPDNQSHILSAARGLSKLRQFDSEDFGQLSRSWVFRMKNYSNRVPLFRAFSSLIPGACLRIEALTSVAANMLSQHQDGVGTLLGFCGNTDDF